MKISNLVLAAMIVLAAGAPGSGSGAPGMPSAKAAVSSKHFDRVLVVVLENQSYVSTMKDPYFQQLAEQGTNFTDFHAVAHPSYPNYLAMVAGSTYGIHGTFGDDQRTFPDDAGHRTIGDFLSWKNYAEDYPAKPGQAPYLYDTAGKYARKHVPFLSFEKVQKETFANVVGVDFQEAHNSFVSDVEASRKNPNDPQFRPLPEYMFYSPNLIDDGHDSTLTTASDWLRNFLDKSLPPDARKGTLIVVTFDEAMGPELRSNHIYTVFLGDMVKKGEKVDQRYDHYDVLRTIEANFGIKETLNDGDAEASVIGNIWK
ncbi:MAG: alkaline phosphatase family protein [Candidatus Acidiferrales bacterium]